MCVTVTQATAQVDMLLRLEQGAEPQGGTKKASLNRSAYGRMLLLLLGPARLAACVGRTE